MNVVSAVIDELVSAVDLCGKSLVEQQERIFMLEAELAAARRALVMYDDCDRNAAAAEKFRPFGSGDGDFMREQVALARAAQGE